MVEKDGTDRPEILPILRMGLGAALKKQMYRSIRLGYIKQEDAEYISQITSVICRGEIIGQIDQSSLLKIGSELV